MHTFNTQSLEIIPPSVFHENWETNHPDLPKGFLGHGTKVSSKAEWLVIPHVNHTYPINTSHLLGHSEWIRPRTHQPVVSHGILWEPLGKRTLFSALVIDSSFSSPLHHEERVLLTVIPTSIKPEVGKNWVLVTFSFFSSWIQPCMKLLCPWTFQ